jgi:hypothetical protein
MWGSTKLHRLETRGQVKVQFERLDDRYVVRLIPSDIDRNRHHAARDEG